MKNIEDKTIAEIVTDNINTAHVFKKYGIDFCCGGGVSIAKACEKKGVDLKELENQLAKVDEVKQQYDYDKWKLDFLIDHIVNVHHVYVTEAIPLVMEYAERVVKIHGHHYTELVEIKRLFTEVADELTVHMKKEEHVLFPFIKEMFIAQENTNPAPVPPFGTINNPIHMMLAEHDLAGDIMKKINQLTKGYNPPPEACNTFRALYAKLEEFEEDLHQHIHLENNILFPKAIAIENS